MNVLLFILLSLLRTEKRINMEFLSCLLKKYAAQLNWRMKCDVTLALSRELLGFRTVLNFGIQKNTYVIRITIHAVKL